MARIDDYQTSFNIAANTIINKDLNTIASNAGGIIDKNNNKLILKYFNRNVCVGGSPLEVNLVEHEYDLQLYEKVLILHYLIGSSKTKDNINISTDNWITFKDVESGRFYWSAFVKRVKTPLLNVFNQSPLLFIESITQIGGSEYKGIWDYSVIIHIFPKVPIIFSLYKDDDEFPANVNVLFNNNINKYLSTEDIVLSSSLPIYIIKSMLAK